MADLNKGADIPTGGHESAPPPVPPVQHGPGHGPGPGAWAGGRGPQGPRAPGSPATTAQAWALGAHLSGPVGAVLSFGALMVVGPLVVMFTEGTRDQWVRRNAVEALNFAITGLIAMAVAYVVMLVTLGLLFIAPIAVGVAYVVLGVIASLKAYRGEDYRYPLTLRLVK